MKSRPAVWFFLFLIVAGVLAATIPYLFASCRQLDSETVDREKIKWDRQKPLNYNLLVRHDREHSQVYRARIRNGKPEEALVDGSFSNGEALDRANISGVFSQLEGWVACKSRFDYLVADFHPVLGYPIRIVWRKIGGIREEWVIRLDALIGG